MRRQAALIALSLMAGCGRSDPLPNVDGTYRNPCCAAVTISQGTIETPTRAISFTLDRDKEGVILVPDKYLGVLKSQGLDIETNGSPLVLRYLAAAGVKSITISGPEGDFVFTRDR